MRQILACAVLLALSVPGHSGTVTVAFSGEVTRAINGALGAVGDPVTGTFSYDPSLPDLDGNFPTIGDYDNSAGSFFMRVGKHTFTYQAGVEGTENHLRAVTSAVGQPPSYSINLTVNYPLLDGKPIPFSGGHPQREIHLGFADTDGRLASGLPQLPPTWDTTLFDQRKGSDFGIGPTFIFSIDTVAVVPEPRGLTLATLSTAGAIACALCRRRAKAVA